MVRSIFARGVFLAVVAWALFFSMPVEMHAAAVVSAKVPAKVPFEFSAWIPYWKMASGTIEILSHDGVFKELSPFAFTVNADGTLYDNIGLGKEPLGSLMRIEQAKGVRIIPSILWNDSEAIDATLRSSKRRAAHIAAIVATVNKYGFDGIDLDYENKKAETRPYFTLFLRDLYKAMGKKFVICTIEPRTPLDSRFTIIPTSIDYANDYSALNQYCDRVRIMTYDQGLADLKLNAANKGQPYIPVSDPLWVEKVIKLASQTIAKKKIIIGIPTYGYEYDVTPLAKGYRYERRYAFNPKYALEISRQYGTTPVRTPSGELSVIYTAPSSPTFSSSSIGMLTNDPSLSNSIMPTTTESNSGTTTPTVSLPFRLAWWSDAQAIADKVALAKKLGVRGVVIFKIDGGQDPGIWKVLK